MKLITDSGAKTTTQLAKSINFRWVKFGGNQK